MAVRKVIQIGHPALKAKNEEVQDFTFPQLKKLIKDLKDTMNKEGLVGIAAPQIAKNFKIFVTQPRNTKTRKLGKADTFRVYINPKIIRVSPNETIIYEGCGSVANGNLFGPVKRPQEITIQALDEKGQKFQLTCDGLLARVIQHEYDHLLGVEFTEKITDYKKILSYDFYVKIIRNSKIQKEAIKITKIDLMRLT